jgi:hypothetical protein
MDFIVGAIFSKAAVIVLDKSGKAAVAKAVFDKKALLESRIFGSVFLDFFICLVLLFLNG